ncbi:MAG: SOS response-associated peptidase [Gemmatimonadetes bacterium]|nr:SOS response-associated peptidase [Gemmatimonadota bacterium]
MCGRFTVACAADEIRDEFRVDLPDDWMPRYNVAPQQPVPVIGRTSSGPLRLSMLRWGLVPHWAKRATPAGKTINARAESLLARRTFRESFLERRCWVIADGFYEWVREGRARRPWRFVLPDRRPFAFAGLWDRWESPEGEALYTCTIVTTEANRTVAQVHDRMPVMLGRSRRDAWLDATAHPDALAPLLRPWPDAELEAYPVSTLVNHVANDGPECIQPAG